MVDIGCAVKRRGKHSPLFTNTEVNNCFSTTQVEYIAPKTTIPVTINRKMIDF